MAEILEQQAQNIDLLTAAVLHNIPTLRQTYGWWSAYCESPKRNVPLLVEMMSELRDLIPARDATLLDCGSGDGVLTVAAALGGFQQTRGIEISDKFVSLSRLIVAPFAKDFNIQIAQGSYYLPEYMNYLLPKCLKELRSRFLQEAIEFINFDEYVRAVLELPENGHDIAQSVGSYLVPHAKRNPYLESGLIDDRGELNADVVYIFPSDIFFETAFLPQMAHVMRNDTHLAVFSPTDDMDFSMPSAFQEVARIPVQLSEAEPMGLRLCKKIE